MTANDKTTITEFTFNEDEVRVLRWLFDDGLEAVGRSGDQTLARQVAALAPDIWNIRSGIATVFDATEVGLLERTIRIGQRANGHLLGSLPVRSADRFALQRLNRKIADRFEQTTSR